MNKEIDEYQAVDGIGALTTAQLHRHRPCGVISGGERVEVKLKLLTHER